MPNVSNAELHKLLLQLQDDLSNKCAGITRANIEGNKVLADKMDSFGERLNKLEQRLDNIDETKCRSY